MRNAGDFEKVDLIVTEHDGSEVTYPGIKSFSADGASKLHVHDADGPVVLYNSSGWLSARVDLGDG